MVNGNGRNGWNRFLVAILWGVVVAFAGLCILGFFHLDAKITLAKENTDIRSVQNTERIVRIEECLVAFKENLTKIEATTNKIYEKVR